LDARKPTLHAPASARNRTIIGWACATAALIVAVVWVANTWSLSSYGLVLKAFGAADTGIVLGEPRDIRSDEWGVITPFIQATVNNGLRRYNATSFYGEDLRAYVSLPIADWGLVFKPDQWLYPFVNAAYAFSFQHLFYVVAFLAGYALLFARFGIPGATASLLAAILFFTAFTQFWWTTTAPTLAWFPWVVLSLGIRRTGVRVAAFFASATAAMLAHFYPPLFIPFAVAGAAIYFGLYFPERRLAGLAADAVAALAACALVSFYLHDYLVATWSSVYPGQRSLNGGNVPAAMLAQTLWPVAHLVGFETDIPGMNVCEASVVGSWYFLMAACFVDWRRLGDPAASPAIRRTLIAGLVAWLALLCWQTLPIPNYVAKWVLFDRVQPNRTMFASGFLLLLVTGLAVHVAGVRFTAARVLIFVVVLTSGAWRATGRGIAMPDMAAIVLAVAALVGGETLCRRGGAAIAGASALLGLATFGPFNPIQSAWPIFNRQPTALTRELDARQKANPLGILVSDQFGATLNGWGYRSAAHVQLAPQPDVWRRLLPDMDETTRNAIFNRFAHIVVRDIVRPELLAFQVVAVPRRAFGENGPVWFFVDKLAGGIAFTQPGGHVDTVATEGTRMRITGWAPWHAAGRGETLTLHADIPLVVVSARRTSRPDVVRVLGDESMRDSGFDVVVETVRGRPLPQPMAFCVVATEPGAGSALIGPDGSDCTTRKR
jgi:hypothetical protein